MDWYMFEPALALRLTALEPTCASLEEMPATIKTTAGSSSEGFFFPRMSVRSTCKISFPLKWRCTSVWGKNKRFIFRGAFFSLVSSALLYGTTEKKAATKNRRETVYF